MIQAIVMKLFAIPSQEELDALIAELAEEIGL